MGPFEKWTDATFGMQHAVDCIGGGGLVGVDAAPRGLKGAVVGAAALGTRAVPIRERGGFVQKEQFRIPARCHDGTVATTKVQAACDPAAHLPVANYPPLGIVQDPAEWRRTISQWHLTGCSPRGGAADRTRCPPRRPARSS